MSKRTAAKKPNVLIAAVQDKSKRLGLQLDAYWTAQIKEALEHNDTVTKQTDRVSTRQVLEMLESAGIKTHQKALFDFAVRVLKRRSWSEPAKAKK